MQHPGSPDLGLEPQEPAGAHGEWKPGQGCDGAKSSPGRAIGLRNPKDLWWTPSAERLCLQGLSHLRPCNHSLPRGQGRDGCVVVKALDTFLLGVQSR